MATTAGALIRDCEGLERAIYEGPPGEPICLAPGTLTIAAPLLVTRDLRLIGEQTEICGDSCRLLEVDGTDARIRVELQGIHFRGGLSEGPGGAIFAQGADLTATECRFVGNQTFRDRTGQGGAIALTDGSLELLKCTFEKNEALTGSAISLRGVASRATLLRCRFTGNRADDGATIQIDEADAVTIVRGDFRGNLGAAEIAIIPPLLGVATLSLRECELRPAERLLLAVRRHSLTLELRGNTISSCVADQLRDLGLSREQKLRGLDAFAESDITVGDLPLATYLRGLAIADDLIVDNSRLVGE